MASFDQFINSIVADGNDGKAFERFCKHFLETSPEYKDQFEKVWLWDDWPKKWSHDKGVDLIAKYKGRDTYCAIQSKCYAAHNTVPYDEVTNFLADSNRADIEDRILMMSTNKLNERTSREVIKGQEKQVVIRDREYFERVNYEYPSHISELNKSKVKKKAEPRPHQADAINSIVKGLRVNDRGQLIMACGTGKTFTTLWIKERLKANTVLVLLPSLSLLSQTMREWVWGAQKHFKALAVCSDPTVGQAADEDISTSEVGKVTWNVDKIKQFLKEEKHKVIFCTYQSSELIQEAQKDESICDFDLVICDEAHRCAGNASSGFATVLHEEKIRSKKRLFTTATPRIYGKSVKTSAEGRGISIVGMDDEEQFGPVLHKLTFGQAIEIKMLTDYQVVVVGVNEPMIRDWIAEGELILTGPKKATDAKTLASEIAVLKAIKDYDLKRVISFHGSIQRAKEFSEQVDNVSNIIEKKNRPTGDIWTHHVDGQMSAGRRRDLIGQLKELDGYDIGLLTNARCLSEGVDVPSLDGIAFIDPKSSQVDIIQAVGRAIRKSDEKSVGTIVLPVFLEEGDDPDQIIEASKFKPIWDVLKALRAHDETLANKIDQYRTDMGFGVIRASNKIDKVIFDLPIEIGEEFSSALSTRIVEATSDNWQFWFGLLLNFKTQFGHSSPEGRFETEDGHKLGNWVVNQRTDRDILLPDRKAKLESLGDWVWSVRDAQWEEGFDRYKEFVKSNATIFVKVDYKEPDGYDLGGWIKTQRDKWNIMSPERQERLLQVGFSLDPDGDRWNREYEKFKKAIEKAKDYKSVPEKYKRWATGQRSAYPENLRPEYISKLEALPGWVWNLREAKWNAHYQALKNYFENNGHTNVSSNYKVDGLKLGQWVNKLRSSKHQQSEERLKRLEAIKFSWNTLETKWLKNFSIYKNYIQEFGTTDIPSRHIYQNEDLGMWVSIQRRDQDSLSNERRDLLESIGFRFEQIDRNEIQWEENFKVAKKFYEREKNLLVKRGYSEDGVGLATWISTQRTSFKKNLLTQEKIQRLEDIGMIWNTRSSKWDKALKALEKFGDREGHYLVPHKHKEGDFPLGEWINKKRTEKEQLSDEKRKQLDDIGMVWDAREYEWEKRS